MQETLMTSLISRPPTSVSAPAPAAAPVKGLHHFAWRCRDAEETRQFYEDVLGLPLAHLIRADNVPSTGELCPYVHLFFQLGDGSYIAFFDLGDNTASAPSPNTPAWVNHIAFEVPSRDALLTAKARLTAANIEVLGVTDHHFIESIYFFDPNGIRLELTVRVDEPGYLDEAARVARTRLDAWTAEKAERRLSVGAGA
jgi:catechol 2,3-dioxygenase-like lactoylglutathione lyase family enzyme